jgi:hypothetical protein
MILVTVLPFRLATVGTLSLLPVHAATVRWLGLVWRWAWKAGASRVIFAAHIRYLPVHYWQELKDKKDYTSPPSSTGTGAINHLLRLVSWAEIF